jgi:MFS family permease
LFFLFPISVSLLMAFLSMILFSVGEMMALPFINAFVVGRSTEYNRGQYAAGYGLCWSVAQVIGPAGGFYIAEAWGYNALWITLFLMLTLSAFAYHLLDKKEKATAPVYGNALPVS